MAHDAYKRIHNPRKQLQNANPQLHELLPVTSRVPTLRTAVRLVVMIQMRCLAPSSNKGGGARDICLLLLCVCVCVFYVCVCVCVCGGGEGRRRSAFLFQSDASKEKLLGAVFCVCSRVPVSLASFDEIRQIGVLFKFLMIRSLCADVKPCSHQTL